MAAHQINTYIWLVDTIASGEISKRELDSRWSRCRYNDDHESQFPDRKFHRYKEDIQALFGIDIACHRVGMEYYYYVPKSNNQHLSETRQWLLSQFAVQSLLDESENLRDTVIYENIPGGTQYLATIVAAIRNHQQLMVGYHKFESEAYQMTFSPYGLKVFKQRWYMVGVSDRHPDEVRVYALDRVKMIKPIDGSHYAIDPSFSMEKFFADFYGVFRDEEPQTVRIRAMRRSPQFLRTLPLHPSQRELESGTIQLRSRGRKEDRLVPYTIFEYRLAPTFDFIQELRTHGADIEVLSPESLVEQFRQEMLALRRLYRKNK